MKEVIQILSVDSTTYHLGPSNTKNIRQDIKRVFFLTSKKESGFNSKDIPPTKTTTSHLKITGTFFPSYFFKGKDHLEPLEEVEGYHSRLSELTVSALMGCGETRWWLS